MTTVVPPGELSLVHGPHNHTEPGTHNKDPGRPSRVTPFATRYDSSPPPPLRPTPPEW